VSPVPPGSRLRFRLGRDQRLRGAREFAQTRETGERRVCGCLVANWRPLPVGEQSRLGVITSRRIGAAVVRNRARRLLRTAFRLNQHQLARPVVLVLVARASITSRPLAAVDRDLRRCLREAGLMLETAPVPPADQRPATPPSAERSSSPCARSS